MKEFTSTDGVEVCKAQELIYEVKKIHLGGGKTQTQPTFFPAFKLNLSQTFLCVF